METPALSPRLAAVAACVPSGHTVADIGTDHGQLPVWLVDTGRSPRAIGIDVAEGPLRQAATTVAGHRGVELRRADGLRGLADGEAQTVVIAGMGGAKIRCIVDAGLPAGVTHLVLQPNTEWPAVRAWIAARGWTLADETIVEDRDKFYVVLTVRLRAPDSAPRWGDADLELGPRLRHRGDPVWRAWVDATLRHLRRADEASAAADPDDPERQRLKRRLAIFAGARDDEGDHGRR